MLSRPDGVEMLAKMGLNAVSATLKPEPAADHSLISASSRAGGRIDGILPIMPIFNEEILAKANKVKQEVSDRIAKIKAMKEEILKPRDCKSKSSIRSGRQMSDDDFNQMSKELGRNIELKKITGSEAGSEIDVLSDRGDVLSNHNARESNPATLEYFAPDSGMTHTRKR